MFKNLNYNPVVKKGPISFIKTSSSPRHVNSAKVIVPSSQHSAIDQYPHSQKPNMLSVEVAYEKNTNVRHLRFPFTADTNVSELIDYLHSELQE